jgi:GNAT superfamily N-acetyltransferase
VEKIAKTRSATEADFPFAWSLYAASVRTALEPHILSERGEAWSDAAEQERFKHVWSVERASVIEVDGAAAGWISIDASGDALVIENFYIEAPLRGKGLGTAILEWAKQTHPAKAIKVDVISGCRSESLYRRLGLEVQKNTDFLVSFKG